MSEFSIDLSGGRYDAISTYANGTFEGISRIVFGNGVSDLSNYILYLHVDGDPKHIQSSEMEVGRNRVRAFAYADIEDGLERSGEGSQEGKGEISIVLVIEADVPISSMARAAITANEAITAVMQDFNIRFDGKFATGSVRQNVTIVSNRDSDVFIRGTGNHSKMGQIIGESCIDAIKKSAKMNGTDGSTTVTELMQGYGISIDGLTELNDPQGLPKDFDQCNSDGKAVAATAAVLHIMDCIGWGLLPEEEATKAGMDIIEATFGTSKGCSSPIEALSKAVSSYLLSSQYHQF